jgi:hypothetical protein
MCNAATTGVQEDLGYAWRSMKGRRCSFGEDGQTLSGTVVEAGPRDGEGIVLGVRVDGESHLREVPLAVVTFISEN